MYLNRERTGVRGKITFRELLESIKVVNKFLSFSTRLAKFFAALAQIGVDVNKLNPYNFDDLLKMAMSMRSRGINIDFGDLDELRQEFEDLMDMDINEIRLHAERIRRYGAVFTGVLRSIQSTSKSMPKDTSDMSSMMGMLGMAGQLIPGQAKTPADTFEEEEDETSNLSERDIEEFRKVIEEYKKSANR